MEPDGHIASWVPLIVSCTERAGRSGKTIDTCRALIEKAGFENVHEELFKVPVGSWAKDERIKELAGLITTPGLMVSKDTAWLC